MSVRSHKVVVLAALTVVLAAPVALAEESSKPPATHHAHDNRHPGSRFKHHHRGPTHPTHSEAPAH